MHIAQKFLSLVPLFRASPGEVRGVFFAACARSFKRLFSQLPASNGLLGRGGCGPCSTGERIVGRLLFVVYLFELLAQNFASVIYAKVPNGLIKFRVRL